MKPCERAVMDQMRAWIRDEADRDEVTEMLGDQRFVAGGTYMLTMILHLLDASAPYQSSLAVADLGEAWHEQIRERFGL